MFKNQTLALVIGLEDMENDQRILQYQYLNNPTLQAGNGTWYMEFGIKRQRFTSSGLYKVSASNIVVKSHKMSSGSDSEYISRL